MSLLPCDFALEVRIFESFGRLTKSDKLHPYLEEILAARRIWKKPQQKKEPVTGPALDCMRLMAHEAMTSDAHGWLSKDAVL